VAKREKLQKTNAMRELERAGIAFDVRTYEVDENDLSGVHVAEQLGEEPGQGFKTLVCETASGGHAVPWRKSSTSRRRRGRSARSRSS